MSSSCYMTTPAKQHLKKYVKGIKEAIAVFIRKEEGNKKERKAPMFISCFYTLRFSFTYKNIVICCSCRI